MIGRSGEYEKMFQLEGQLWWYRSLHERVVQALQQQFGSRRDITILDVGCGTGGLLALLRQRGYSTIQGLDGSADAVDYCQQRALAVTRLNLNDLAYFEPQTQYDALICNDVCCYFTDAELPALLVAMANRLKPGGILITNNNAFDAFGGQHDVAVGVIRRFTQPEFSRLIRPAGLRIKRATYWSFGLSLPILLVRQWQRFQLDMGWRSLEQAQSDVYMPKTWLNNGLYRLVETERKLLPRTPFGSSLFMIISPA